MNSLSTSAFSPVAFSLGLLLAMATAFPTPGPLGEDFKGDTTSDRPVLTSPDKTEALIKYILSKISAVRKELCEKYDRCENSKEAIIENNLNLPKMTEKDGCFQTKFNQEICLTRTTTGLLIYQMYLDYLQHGYEGDKGNIETMQIVIRALVQILRQKNPGEVTTPDPTANTSLLNNLQTHNEWMKHKRIIFILRSFENFLQFSLRAIRMK
ncbi:interleukin-6 isoform X2 [Hippopotamus amphibius kiboko]|uniref:interleukin-6 isoform X2 n=1 Tax=Hippopotamus amphibius kiboko TaxID=575201 RepID=UPI0025961EB2|nr:interleukin-6 isoform X2 [Hippopotamus amphibius kiboko]